MTWNSILEQPVMWSGASPDASELRPLWSCAARCSWWQREPAASFLSLLLTCNSLVGCSQLFSHETIRHFGVCGAMEPESGLGRRSKKSKRNHLALSEQ